MIWSCGLSVSGSKIPIRATRGCPWTNMGGNKISAMKAAHASKVRLGFNRFKAT
jgi:hypothetical protein